MNNIFRISDVEKLNGIIETSDRLVLILFNKGSKECHHAKNMIEKIASSNKLTLFCLVDLRELNGNSKYTKIIEFPRLDSYYQGKLYESIYSFEEYKIKNIIEKAERNITNKNNPKNDKLELHLMVQNKILDRIEHTDPELYQYIKKNPNELKKMVELQIKKMENQNNQSSYSIPDYNQNNSNNEINTIKQMKYMFEIFTMMQTMGVLEIPKIDNKDEIILDNGDKIIPLKNGKYGLIKSKK